MRHVLQVIFAPVEAMKELAEERPLLPAMVLTMLVGVSWWYGFRWMACWGGVDPLMQRAESCAVVGPAVGVMLQVHPLAPLFLAPTFAVAIWVLRSALIHLVAELFGGTGRALSTLATIAYAMTPVLLFAPLAVVLAAANEWALDTGWPALVWRLAAVLLYLWVVLLVFTAVRETHDLTSRTAVLTLVSLAAAAVVLHALLWAGCAVSGFALTDLLA